MTKPPNSGKIRRTFESLRLMLEYVPSIQISPRLNYLAGGSYVKKTKSFEKHFRQDCR